MEKRLFNHTGHKLLWSWMRDNPGHKKSEWPGWKENGGEYSALNYSFACEYVQNIPKRGIGLCREKWIECGEYCPLLWPDGAGCYDELDWWSTFIMELPVRKGVKCI